MNAKITIFTPTYNRAYIIEKLYYSLQRQKNKSFEWLVVDDGSVDNTRVLFDKWTKEKNEFTIRYYKIINGGKQRAVNYGLDLAQCEYFMVVDSDDYLVENAIEKICTWISLLEDDNSVMGIVANKGYSENETPNECFEAEFLDNTLLQMNTYLENGKKVLFGEKAICFKTDFHRNYRYPEFAGEKFVTEAVVYNRMSDDGFAMRFYNDIIVIYEYRDDGLTKQGNTLFLNNPRGYGLWLKEKAEFEKKSLKEKMKMYYTFTCDLSEKYENKIIAESIGAPLFLIVIIRILHNCKVFLHRKKKENDKENY